MLWAKFKILVQDQVEVQDQNKVQKELELWATAPLPIANFGRPVSCV
jgi:hypothetical protein